jgi:hypothetical protein
MKKYAFITSMNQQYYGHIGRFMLESFLKYAPKHFVLHLYAESITSELPRANNLVIYDWNQVCKADWEKFAVKTDDSSAQKFGKKGWASIHAWENIDADKLIWLDADLLFHKEFDEEIIELTLPKKKLIGLFDQNYLQETGLSKPSAETGYVILNKRHPDFESFVKEYRRNYELPEKPDSLHRWWDNQICMLVANQFKDHVYDLSDLRTTDKTQTPLNRSPIAEYFSHQKGKSKKHMDEYDFKERTGL